MKVIDNFLDDEYFKSIQNYMMSPEIKWSFTDGINRPDDDNYQFVSMIYDDVDLYVSGGLTRLGNFFIGRVPNI